MKRSNPHTPSFPVEKENNNVEEYVRRIVKPIFDKALQETPKNRVSVGGGRFEGKKDLGIVYYNPHNYRLYFDFSKVDFHPQRSNKTDPSGSVYIYKTLNHGSEHHYDGFLGCIITVKKNTILLTPKNKREYVVDLNKPIHPQCIEAIKEKDKLIMDALRGFIKFFGGSSKFVIVNRWVGENKIIGESAIQKMDSNMLFRNPLVKKVYSENNVEWSDPVYCVNYLQTRALEDSLVPDLYDAVATILINMNPLGYLKKVIVSFEDVLNYGYVVDLMSNIEKHELEEWCFVKFGVRT